MDITFNNITATLEPDTEGLYDLNDIWRTFNLPENKRPSEWRDATRKALVRSANLRSKGCSGTTAGCERGGGQTLGTRIALFSYAAWVSFEFHMAVFQTFDHVVSGDLEAATEAATKVARDPLSQLLRDHYNPNRPHRRWQQVVRQYLLEDPWEGYDRIMKAYGDAKLSTDAKDDFFKQIRRIIEGLIKDSSKFQIISNLEAVGRQFEKRSVYVLRYNKAV